MSSTEALDRQFRTILNKKTNREEKIPAIDRVFKEERDCLQFMAPPLCLLSPGSAKYQATLEEYMERLVLIERDLKWLLSLGYQKFWCQVVYDSSTQKMIDSYLKYAPRPYDVLKVNLNDQVSALLKSIHKYVFLVCLRMSTHKESQDNFLTPEAFANLIYENFLFDIPKILDLCVLYQNNPVLSKLIENLFNLQPNYFDDFRHCIKDIIKAIETSKRKLRDIFKLDVEFSVDEPVDKTDDNLHSYISKHIKETFEIVYYLTDFVITLKSLISIIVPLSDFLFEQKFEKSIRDFMDSTVFDIEDTLNRMKKSDDPEYSETARLIRSKIKWLKYEFASVYNKILHISCINPILENADKASNQIDYYVDNFMKVCCDMLEDRRFLCYFERKFNLTDSLDVVYQLSGKKIDSSQLNYIIENLKLVVQQGPQKKKSSSKIVEKAFNVPTASVKPSTSGIGDDQEDALRSVLDLFPNMDKAYLKKCLNYYNQNVEQLINSLLENNLPQFDAEKTTPKANVDTEEEDTFPDELTTRRNIYENDEFDIFRRENVDLNKIHSGKSNKTDKLDLDDKSDVKAYHYTNEQYEYEDEYDDTYDSNINAPDNDETAFIVKPLNKQLTMKKKDQFDEDDDEDESDQEIEANQANQKSKEAAGPGAKGKESNFQNTQQKNVPMTNRKQDKPYQQREQRGDRMPQRQDQRRPQQQQQQHHQQGNRFNNNEDFSVIDRPSTSGEANRSNAPGANRQPQRDQPLPQRQRNNNREQRGNQQHHHPQQQQQQQQHQQQPHQQNQNQRHHNQERHPPMRRNKAEEEYSDEYETAGAGAASAQPNAAAGGGGAPKSQEELKRDRKWKTENKSKLAHHNRKDLAAKKMNRGFL